MHEGWSELNSFTGKPWTMLKSLFIDNYALIEKLEIEFQKGLTIITGETGAGKSILLGALALILGKRADTAILKDHNRKCVVEGIFSIHGYALESFFRENDLEYNTELIIRREIASTGNNRAFINDTPATLDVLQNLSLYLIDIHSQHQNLLLNKEAYLRWIIDNYAKTFSILREYSILFEEVQKLHRQYQEQQEAYTKDSENLDYLTHQLNELQIAALKQDELPLLEQEQEQMSHVEEIKSGLEGSVQMISDEETGVIRHLKQTHDLLAKTEKYLQPLSILKNRLDSVYIEIKDVLNELQSLFEKVEFDPDRLNSINHRLDTLYTLLRKYKVNSVNELIIQRDELATRLQQHSSGNYQLDELKKQLALKEQQMMDAAGKLSRQRKSVFPEIEQKVVSLLRDLGMQNTEFTVHAEEDEPAFHGIDRIQFLFSANKNIPVQNIARVASGGELSRLMLVIKYLISNSSGLPTIIFDEIDSGVSGEIADKVGRLVKSMAGNMQVINITHLPQVASKGDEHFVVYKSSTEGTTQTYIKKLNESERIFEIARMLSGDSITDAALENARVLLGR